MAGQGYFVFFILYIVFQYLPPGSSLKFPHSDTKEYFQYKFSLQRSLLEEKEEEMSGYKKQLTEVSKLVVIPSYL